jgi:hypothetical protein
VSKKTVEQNEPKQQLLPVFTGKIRAVTPELLIQRAGLTSRIKEDHQKLFVGKSGIEKETLERRRRGLSVGKIMSFFGMIEGFQEAEPSTQVPFILFYEKIEQEVDALPYDEKKAIVNNAYEHPVLQTLKAIDAISNRTDFRDTQLIPMQRGAALLIHKLANGQLPTKQ